MTDLEKLEYIRKNLSSPAQLEQLAEECAELGRAALKLARKHRGENPTPVYMPDVVENLYEEAADVLLCLTVEGFDRDNLEARQRRKLERWYHRVARDGEDGD